MPNPTMKFDRMLRGPETLTAAGSSTATVWSQLLSVTSHTVVVSTQQIAADSLVRLTTQWFPGSATPVFAVASINPGATFSIQCASWNLASLSTKVHWEIVNPKVPS